MATNINRVSPKISPNISPSIMSALSGTSAMQQTAQAQQAYAQAQQKVRYMYQGLQSARPRPPITTSGFGGGVTNGYVDTAIGTTGTYTYDESSTISEADIKIQIIRLQNPITAELLQKSKLDKKVDEIFNDLRRMVQGRMGAGKKFNKFVKQLA